MTTERIKQLAEEFARTYAGDANTHLIAFGTIVADLAVDEFADRMEEWDNCRKCAEGETPCVGHDPGDRAYGY